jgi:hypothetical protein
MEPAAGGGVKGNADSRSQRRQFTGSPRVWLRDREDHHGEAHERQCQKGERIRVGMRGHLKE